MIFPISLPISLVAAASVVVSSVAAPCFGNSEDFGSSRGQDVEIDLPVFLEETLSDEKKTISYQMPKYDGSGRVEQVKENPQRKDPEEASATASASASKARAAQASARAPLAIYT